MEAISHAGTAVGILSSDGVVLAAEKKITSKLLEPSKSSEKMYMIDEHVACAVAGITADANILINYARQAAQRYQFTYQEAMPVEQLVQALCDTKQGYTQYGGLRPFGVSVLYAGWDAQHGYQLYCSDPSGNYGGWMATSIGASTQAAQSIMKQEYKPGEMSLQAALGLAVKVLSKTCDSANLTPDKRARGAARRAEARRARPCTPRAAAPAHLAARSLAARALAARRSRHRHRHTARRPSVVRAAAGRRNEEAARRGRRRGRVGRRVRRRARAPLAARTAVGLAAPRRAQTPRGSPGRRSDADGAGSATPGATSSAGGARSWWALVRSGRCAGLGPPSDCGSLRSEALLSCATQ